jgi:hypothetical protein
MIVFCTAVGFTVVFLTVVVVTGLRGRITVHIPCVLATLVSLVIAIVYALELGKIYDLPGTGAIFTVHMAVAKLAAASYVLPVITGIRTLKSRVHRRTHFRAAMFVLAMTAAASITGTWMLVAAQKLPG